MNSSNDSSKFRPTTFFAVVAALAVAFGFLVVADEVEASHYVGATLQWNYESENQGLEALLNSLQDRHLATFSGEMAWRWSSWVYSSMATCTIHSGEGSLQFSDGSSERFSLVLMEVDSTEDVGVGRIVREGAPASACNHSPDDPAWHVTHLFQGTSGPGGANHEVWYDNCCRISGPNAFAGRMHVNNPDSRTHLESAVDLTVNQGSPIVDLEPIQTCEVNSECTFQINATDPDADRLQFRLAGHADAGGVFYQPGPSCPNCATVQNAATINSQTGVVTWDTHGAEVYATCTAGEPQCPHGDRYNHFSMMVMVGDGTTEVPVDFLIKIVRQSETPPPQEPPEEEDDDEDDDDQGEDEQ